MEVKRVFHPLDVNSSKEEILPQLIPKRQSALTPVWKLELVKESFALITSEQDIGEE